MTRTAKLVLDFGTRLALDGKAVHSVRRSDAEAGAGRKTTTDGEETVVFTWLGFKIHCLADTVHELPVAFRVTPADDGGESPRLLPILREARHYFGCPA